MIDYLGEQKPLNLYERHIRPARLMQINQKIFDKKYLKFAVARNTWDWHCSQYYFHKYSSKTMFHEEVRNLTFSEYIDWACIERNIVRANSRQKQYLSSEQGTLLVDKVLRFENLEREFSLICKELGLSASIETKNKSLRKKYYKEEYSKNDRKKIEKSHREDIDFFGFDF